MTAILFRLRIVHDWYADGRLPGWSLAASPETGAIMRRFGLWLHSGMSEFALCATTDGDEGAFLGALGRATDEGPLRFRLGGDQEHLMQVSDLPPGSRRLPDYTSRASSLLQESGTTFRQLLAQAAKTDTHSEVCFYPHDLTSALPISDWQIHFGARALPWTYYVVNRSQFPLEQPVVRRADGLCLRGPESVNLPDGERAFRFDSGDLALPLQEYARAQFGLYDRVHSPLSEQAAEVCLVRKLPAPSPGSLEWAGTGDERRIRATVCVYL